MKQFIEMIESHRKEAIYNYSYKYIKEIIWDDEKNEKYGDGRVGYEIFTQENEVSVSFSGIESLRKVYDMDNNVKSYILETKKEVNDPLMEIIDIYNSAVDYFCNKLGSTDSKILRWWIDSNIEVNPREVNSYLSAVKELNSYLIDYEIYEDFRLFIDKIK